MADTALLQQKDQKTDLAHPERTRSVLSYTPRVDIFEAEDELILFVDMPGVHAEDVEVRFENGELVIHGKCAPRHEGAVYLGCEYGVGDYYRVFTINETIDVDGIAAELKQGVLTVHLPKSEAVKPKRIAIKGD